MIRRIHAEWLKAPRVTLVVLTLLTIAFALANSAVAQDHALVEKEAARSSLDSRFLGSPNDPMYEGNLKHAQEFAEQAREMENLAADTQTLLGSFSFTGGLFCTVPGFCIVGLIAATLVAREWSRGTATGMFLSNPSLRQVLSSKMLAVCLETIAIYFAVSFATAAFGIFFGSSVWPLHSSNPGITFTKISRILLVAPIVLIFSAILVAAASSAKSWLRAVLGTVLVGGLLSIICSVPRIAPWTPFGASLELGRFTYYHGVWDHWVRLPEFKKQAYAYAELNHSGPAFMHVAFIVAATSLLLFLTILVHRKRGILR